MLVYLMFLDLFGMEESVTAHSPDQESATKLGNGRLLETKTLVTGLTDGGRSDKRRGLGSSARVRLYLWRRMIQFSAHSRSKIREYSPEA